MKINLAEILIQHIEFLGLAPDSQIHPDAAVRQLEVVASQLKELPEKELGQFLAQASIRLKKLRDEGASQEQIDFLQNIRENLGI